MKKKSSSDLFLDYVKNTRDCGEARLDFAVSRGLARARNEKTDSRKLLGLIAACAFTAVMGFTITLPPFKAAAEGYYQGRLQAMPGAAEALNGYIEDLADTVKVLAELELFKTRH